MPLTPYAVLEHQGVNVSLHTPLSEAYPIHNIFDAIYPPLGNFCRRFGNIDGWEATSVKFFDDNYDILMISLLLYLPVIFGGRYLMQDRKPFDLRYPLIAWNLAMSLFSLLGSIYLLPMYARIFQDVGWFNGVCTRWCFAYGEESFLIFLFDLSKMVEFVDTIFIVLRKKPLIFLHYYHHVITMTFCWVMNQSSHLYGCHGFHFATMNFFVHFVMYSYYGLMACRIRMPGWVSTAITTMQIIQMIIGVSIVSTLGMCERTDGFTVGFGAALYMSFFLLFAKFFYDRYVGGKRAAGKSAQPAGGKSKKTQ